MDNKKLQIFLFTLVFALLFVNTVNALDSLGTFKQGNEVRVTQVCSNSTYINISSIAYPNGTIAVSNIEMTSAGSGEYYYNFNDTNALGQYHVRGISDGCENTFATYFEVNLAGVDPNSSNPYISLGLLGLIFGIACVFLFLSFKLQGTGPKLFFIISSFVFLMGSLAISYVVSFDNNLTPAINTTITTMMYAFGMIFIVVFAYIMINQIKAVVGSFQEGKGYEADI